MQSCGSSGDPDDWTKLVTTPVSHITGRGYTMHEHLDNFALINMNGRVYDPQIARFLSPDPQLQAPGNWLNYNRYTYCFNNPLIYYDPTGRRTWFGKFFNWVGEGIDNATDWFWDTTYQFRNYLNDKGIYPNINVGYNTSQNFFIESGNYRYYLNQGKTNPEANVNRKINDAMKHEAFLKGNTPSLPELDYSSGDNKGWLCKTGSWVRNNVLKDGALEGYSDGANTGYTNWSWESDDVQIPLKIIGSMATLGASAEIQGTMRIIGFVSVGNNILSLSGLDSKIPGYYNPYFTTARDATFVATDFISNPIGIFQTPATAVDIMSLWNDSKAIKK